MRARDLWRSALLPFVSVVLSHNLRIDVEPFVRIYANAKQSGISVNEKTVVTCPQIVKDASPVQYGQVGHVLFL